MTIFWKEKFLLFFIITPILIGLVFYIFLVDYSSIQAQTATTSLSVTVGTCGNGVIDAGEDCDGGDLGGQTCIGLDYDGGTLSCQGDCTFDISACTDVGPPGGGGGPALPPGGTHVILQGKAYPEAIINILIDGDFFTIITADSESDFKVRLVDFTLGVYTFGLRAQDKQGRF